MQDVTVPLTDLLPSRGGEGGAILLIEVKSDHRSKFSNLSNWKEEA